MTRTAAIVCGAGVSSTFLARAVRTLATERGLDWHVEPLAEAELPRRIDVLSYVLVGHHLAGRFAELKAALAINGVPAALLEASDPVAAAEQGVALLLSLDTASTVSEGHSHG